MVLALPKVISFFAFLALELLTVIKDCDWLSFCKWFNCLSRISFLSNASFRPLWYSSIMLACSTITEWTDLWSIEDPFRILFKIFPFITFTSWVFLVSWIMIFISLFTADLFNFELDFADDSLTLYNFIKLISLRFLDERFRCTIRLVIKILICIWRFCKQLILWITIPVFSSRTFCLSC